MKDLIYYPTFEPQNLSWLKYALIYIDGFSPIIPQSGQSGLSTQFREIRDKTDLINAIEPNHRYSDNAATKAINELENVFRFPEQYRDKLNSVNPIRTFRNQENWHFKLFQEKYNVEFRGYCLDESLAMETDGGILLSKEIAQFYMTFLADEIAYQLKTSIITDDENLDRLSSYLRIKGDEDLVQAAKITINLSLPKDIEEIQLSKFIEFRNDSSISELRKSFNKTLNDFLESVEHDFDVAEFLASLEKKNSEFIKEMGLFFGGLTSASLGALILLQSNDPNSIEIAKAIVEGSSLAIGGGYAMKKSWELNNERRNARKFLSRIDKLKKDKKGCIQSSRLPR